MTFTIDELRSVTNNFAEHNVLGRGGFGVVYKGVMPDGTKIAVKRMEAAVVSSKGLKEFQSEIEVLTKVKHRHLVGLLGYCTDGIERLLVYEYMSQGTLAEHLFKYEEMQVKPLSWTQRLTIALDVGQAVEYLHGLAHRSFIHRDLKPSNVLLNDDFRAKVSDFGLVKLAPEGTLHSVETRLAGTFGYLAPEYAGKPAPQLNPQPQRNSVGHTFRTSEHFVLNTKPNVSSDSCWKSIEIALTSIDIDLVPHFELQKLDHLLESA